MGRGIVRRKVFNGLKIALPGEIAVSPLLPRTPAGIILETAQRKETKMITTTLNKIRESGPCADGWEKLLKHLGKTQADDEVLPFSVIVESNGIDDALWCCRAEPQYAKEWRLYAVWCARQVEHLMTDERSRNALNVAERYANGQATDEEFAAARAARDAAWAAARDAAWDAQKKKFLEIVG